MVDRVLSTPLNYTSILSSKIIMVVKVSTLANKSHEFGLVPTFVHPSVRLPDCELTTQILKFASSFFFPDVLHEVRESKSRKSNGS